MSFTDLATVKTILGITDSSQDALLTLYVDAVNAELLDLFHLTSCSPTSYVNEYDVLDEAPGLWLQEYPVITVDAVEVEGVAQAGDSFYLDARAGEFGCLMRRYSGTPSVHAQWPVGPKIVKVTHTAGWSGGVPDAALRNAAALMVVHHYNTGSKQGFESERIGQYSYKLGSGIGSGQGAGGAEAGGYPAPVARTLARWLRPFADGG